MSALSVGLPFAVSEDLSTVVGNVGSECILGHLFVKLTSSRMGVLATPENTMGE